MGGVSQQAVMVVNILLSTKLVMLCVGLLHRRWSISLTPLWQTLLRRLRMHASTCPSACLKLLVRTHRVVTESFCIGDDEGQKVRDDRVAL